MKIVVNRVIWSKVMGKYVLLRWGRVGDEEGWVATDLEVPRYANQWVPMFQNEIGYTCWKCQGFIKYGEQHTCRTVLVWIGEEKNEWGRMGVLDLLSKVWLLAKEQYHKLPGLVMWKVRFNRHPGGHPLRRGRG